MADEANQLRQELKRLRRDEGRTLVKLLASSTLRVALGNPAEAQLLTAFDGAVESLGSDLKSLALKNAYAIGAREPDNLTNRRHAYSASLPSHRGPDTITNWENEQIDELVARLVAGAALPTHAHHMIAVAVSAGRITVVAEGQAESGAPMRQLFNPNPEPFLPGFLYQLPEHLHPDRLTISVMFMDTPPAAVYAAAAGDLLAFVCGDERQKLTVTPGGIPGLDAAAYASVHWNQPDHGVYFGLSWHSTLPQDGDVGSDAPG